MEGEVYKNHTTALQSKNDSAILYKEQNNYDKGEQFFLEALEGRRWKLGDEDSDTSGSTNNLIDLYEAWNKPEKANDWRAKLTQIEDLEE